MSLYYLAGLLIEQRHSRIKLLGFAFKKIVFIFCEVARGIEGFDAEYSDTSGDIKVHKRRA